MLAAQSFESFRNCSDWDGSDSSQTLCATSIEEASVISTKSGVLQELFSNLQLDSEADDRLPEHQQPAVDDDLCSRFDRPDTPENVVLDGEGRIVAATVVKLVERLTFGADTAFAEDFLMSFRSFMSAVTLSKLLSFRLTQGFLSLTNKSQTQCLKLRTFVVLRDWLKNYHDVDFGHDAVRQPILDALEAIRSSKVTLTLSDQQIIMTLRRLTIADDRSNGEAIAQEDWFQDDSDDLVREERSNSFASSSDSRKGYTQRWMARLGSKFLKVFGTNSDHGERVSLETCPSLSDASSSLALSERWQKYEKKSCLAIESSEIISQQLCLIESHYFNLIAWQELLHYPKTSGKLEESIDHFNEMCQWFISEVIHAPSHQAQAQRTSKLLRVCLKSLGRQNYCTVVQIMLALQNPTIEGMEQMWKRISECEKELFDDLVEFVSPLKNFRNIRRAMELQEVSNAPCVPFTGLYLSDLVTHTERLKTSNATDDLIPWFKCQCSARIIRQFRAFQAPERRYLFAANPSLYHYILDCCAQVQHDD